MIEHCGLPMLGLLVLLLVSVQGCGSRDDPTDPGGDQDPGSERIVWSGRSDGTFDWEIWVYDKYATPRFRALTDDDEDQITDDNYDDTDPSLSGSYIAWSGRPDGQDGAYQIMYVDLRSGPAGQ